MGKIIFSLEAVLFWGAVLCLSAFIFLEMQQLDQKALIFLQFAALLWGVNKLIRYRLHGVIQITYAFTVKSSSPVFLRLLAFGYSILIIIFGLTVFF